MFKALEKAADKQTEGDLEINLDKAADEHAEGDLDINDPEVKASSYRMPRTTISPSSHTGY
jgi:hypothetical protein